MFQEIYCMPMNTEKEKKKCRLDSAGKLFTYSSSRKIPCVYRFWAEMKELVDVDILQKALNTTFTRFPYFQVQLTRGLFWHRWKKALYPPRVEKEKKYPCQFIPIRNKNTFPYRIIANQNQIVIEFFHGLTDGNGALQFLRTLITQYLSLKGFTIDNWGDVFLPGEPVPLEETEYAYRKNFKVGIPKIPKIHRAFHLPFKRENKGVAYVTSGKVNVNDILAIAKKWNCTLTEFLTAIYIDVLQEIMFELPERVRRRRKRHINVMLPIDTRRIIPSKTMRNFITFIAPGIDPRKGRYSFEEIVERVHYYKKRYLNKKYILQQISYYVAIEVNPFVNALPSFLKLLLVKPLYRKMGEELFSAFLTNLGKTNLPPEICNEVKDINILPMNHPYFKTGCGFITYFNDLNINFVRNIKEDIVEEKFFNKLRFFGLDVKVRRLF
ncbi:MAG: hypothetical protein DRP02_11390 [Candidatus Gerdarchaeota archaeon]|nr:MAG: hypothetical protein DRP02_11390 [Candidatus Gerdarchaeota archaeon]